MVGKPKRTVIWGRSMGGLMALEMIEKFHGIYDGAIALCPPASGAPRRFDLALDVALAYAAVFGWNDDWGTPGDIRDNVDFVKDKIYADIVSHMTPAHPGPAVAADRYWEFIRLVTHIPVPNLPDDTFYSGSNRWMPVYFATAVRAELESRAGGPISENIGRTYTLSESEVSSLKALGLDPAPYLDEMNKHVSYIAARNARNYVEHYADPTGRLNRPVLTVHTEGDALAIPNHEAAYREVVDLAGNTDLLMQQFVKGGSHCSFTSAQIQAAIGAMMAWLDTGQKPDASKYFSPAVGFDPGYDLAKYKWPW
jgi:pimeloyl-ACP methyl ester carboxylesterase